MTAPLGPVDWRRSLSGMAEMKRPGRWGENPEAIRPKVKIISWNWWTAMALLVLLAWLAHRFVFT